MRENKLVNEMELVDIREFIKTANDEELLDKYNEYLKIFKNGTSDETFEIFFMLDIMTYEKGKRYFEKKINSKEPTELMIDAERVVLEEITEKIQEYYDVFSKSRDDEYGFCEMILAQELVFRYLEEYRKNPDG